MNFLTGKNGSISSQEAILQGLFNVTLFEGLLLRHNLVKKFPGIDSHLVTSVAIVHAEEAKPLVQGGRGYLLACLSAVGVQVENGSVRVLHTNAPALHRRNTVDEGFALAIVRVLERSKRQQGSCERTGSTLLVGCRRAESLLARSGRAPVAGAWRRRDGATNLLDHGLRESLPHPAHFLREFCEDGFGERKTECELIALREHRFGPGDGGGAAPELRSRSVPWKGMWDR